jgi:hypothetical protein
MQPGNLVRIARDSIPLGVPEGTIGLIVKAQERTLTPNLAALLGVAVPGPGAYKLFHIKIISNTDPAIHGAVRRYLVQDLRLIS